MLEPMNTYPWQASSNARHWLIHDTISKLLHIKGLGDLRKAVAAFHFQHDGLSYDQDSVVIGPGSKEMIYLAIKLFDGGTLWAEETLRFLYFSSIALYLV